MIFYPKAFYKNVTEITYDYLKENNIEALILDMDNTLIDYDRNMPEEIKKWTNDIREKGIKLFILSNTNKEEKVKEVADKLNLEYIHFGMKPFKQGFKKAKEKLNLSNEKIAVVGDQIFTDIIGANRMKMFPILVEPLKEKDIFITLVKRPIENFIKRKYLSTKEEK